jgi:flagellar basal body P-ring formation protein FlgA
MLRIWIRLLALACVLLWPSFAVGQASIELRSSSRMVAGMPVTLGQIAALRGDEAVALAGIIIVPATQGPIAGPLTLGIEQVRHAVDAAEKVNWSRLTLRGSRCVVLPAETESPAPVVKPEPQPATRIDPGTIRAAILTRLEQMTGEPAERLRLSFDAREDQLLDTPTAGRTIEVNATALSDRMPFSIRVYERDRTIAEGTVRVGVEVERRVARTTRAIRRGESMPHDAIAVEDAWTPLTAKPASPDSITSHTARDRLDKGQIIATDDVAAAVAVQRGELVSVRVVSGSVVVQTKARALAAARAGELVRLKAIDTDREYTARMDGRGRALIVTGETPSESPGPSNPASARVPRRQPAAK